MNITEADKKYLSKRDDWKTFQKIIKQMLLMTYTLKRQKYGVPIFPKLIVIVKKKIVLMIPNEEKKSWHYFPVQKLSPLLKVIT